MDAMEKWVHETYAPIVLTCTTSEVERISQKNNLSFADLLNGFSMITDADTPIRSVSHQFTLTNFNFRFIGASQFNALPLADATRLINESVTLCPPAPATGSSALIDLDFPKINTIEDVPVYLRAIGVTENSDPLPWYREFTRTLMDTFRGEEASMMWQPAAMLLIVSSTEGNPRHCFEELGASQNLPPSFHQGLYDPNVPKYYLVVHDTCETEGTGIDPDAILRNLNLPTPNAAVLRVNSVPDDQASDKHSHIWRKHPFVRPPLFPANVGTFSSVTDHIGGILSNEDVARIHSFVREFGLRFVLPSLEARIFQLNEIVSAMKKGVKNVFKSWLRKPKDISTRSSGVGTSGSNGSVTYRFDSIESQTRLLGDTAFMIHDYDLALQMYRLARDDYKSDKSMFHGASTNEMIALCLLLTKGSPMQMTNALEAASSIYMKVNNVITSRLAVRSAVIAGELYHTLSHSGLFTDYMDNASAALIRGSTMEQGICSAVLMERAALCDIQSRLPKFRKYGFRMVMAGHIYDSLGHGPHSARCYALARAIYDCSGWFQVEDHINFTLAQQANRLNDPMVSINLFLKLIGTGRNSASQQEALLYEFGLIVKEFLLTADSRSSSRTTGGSILVRDGKDHTKKLWIKDLCMPELDDKSTVVFAPVNAFGINRDIDGNPMEKDRWKELEELVDKQNRLHQYAMSAGTSGNTDGKERSKWLAPTQAYAMPYRNKKNPVNKVPENYALGEKIYVEFVMKNPLSCAVDVENVHLYGKFEVAGDSSETFDVPETIEEGEVRIAVDSVNLQLLPCSEERVRLAMCPNVRGKLSIIGVRWSVCGGDVHGEHAFNIPGPLLQDTRANREGRARAPNMSLIANVVGPMPWLGVKIDYCPYDVFVGEVIKMKVTLVNSGTAGLAGLQLSCPDLLLCVSTADIPTSENLAPYIGASGQVLDLSDVTLAPGESKNIVIWAKGSVVGRQEVPLLFRYMRAASGDAQTTPMFRAVKIKVELNFVPCVDVSYSIDPSFASNGEYVIGVTVQNQRRDAGTDAPHGIVRLENVLCVSNFWTIERFDTPKSTHIADDQPTPRDSTQLGFHEASTTYFRVIPCDASSSKVTYQSSLLSLSSQDAALNDVFTKLPLEQFLCLEHAQDLIRGANAGDADGNEGKRGGGFRTIQSVRRENKALKTQQNNGEIDATILKNDPQPTSKGALLSSQDVDGHLILVWFTERSQFDSSEQRSTLVVGQTNMPSIRVRQPLRSNACPLTLTLSYEDSISLRPLNEAAISGRCFGELDILMTVRNDSTLSSPPIDFTLELLHPQEAKPFPSDHISHARQGKASNLVGLFAPGVTPAPHFFWAGVTKKRISGFSPNAQVTINLKACFMASGVYDLNRFRFTIHSTAGTTNAQAAPTTFVFPAEYLVYVKPPTSSGEVITHENNLADVTELFHNGVGANDELIAVP